MTIYINNEQDNVNPSTNNSIQGNYIGIGADGLTALPAGYVNGVGNAILFGNSHNDIVGGTVTGAKNVIGSSKEFGISFRDGCSDSLVQGNFIGTDYTGNASPVHADGVGNTNSGVHIFALNDISHDITVGGNTPGARNVISGNQNTTAFWTPDGVEIDNGSYNNIIQGNYIGVGANGTTALGNEGAGISIMEDDSNNNVIGGTGVGEGNVIANNGEPGVKIGALNTDDLNSNVILGNSIFNNNGLGIDLGASGISNNDAGDNDSGPNDLLNAPMLLAVTPNGANTGISYELDLPAGDYRIEFFTNTAQDLSGRGEGEEYIGFQNISHTGSGIESFNVLLTGVSGVTNLSMTATERNVNSDSGFGSTSEYSGTSSTTTNIDTSLTKTLLNSSSVALDTDIIYRFTITNNGNIPVELTALDASIMGQNSLIFDIAPPELVYVSENSSDVACATPISASLLGPLLGNHPDHMLINCGYVGVSRLMFNGDSFSFDMTFHIAPSSDLNFTNYAFTAVGGGDPDVSAFGAAFVSGGDIVDQLAGLNENFPLATFAPPTITTTTSPTTIIPARGVSSLVGGLPVTGSNVAMLLLIASSLILGGFIFVRRTRRQLI